MQQTQARPVEVPVQCKSKLECPHCRTAIKKKHFKSHVDGCLEALAAIAKAKK